MSYRNTHLTDGVLECTSVYERLQGKKELIERQLSDMKIKAKKLQRMQEDLEKALAITQKVAQMTQEELEYRISSIVTAALESVFPEPYEFKVIFEIKRGKTEARLVFMDGENELDPLTASGGGVVDVASFALRLSAYMITSPKPQPTLILDEPFRFVSEEYQEKVADLLEELSEKMDVQFIIVTHENSLKRGNIIEWNSAI